MWGYLCNATSLRETLLEKTLTMRFSILLLFITISCTFQHQNDCVEVIPIVTNDLSKHEYKQFEIYILSLSKSTLVDISSIKLNDTKLKGDIVSFGSTQYKGQHYSIKKDTFTINRYISLSLPNKCFKFKLSPLLHNYIINIETLDSVTCIGNNQEFTAIE
jgi:hypothetical protein